MVLDNFFTGRKSNVEHWLHHPNFSLVRHDVILPILLEVDQIYHLACPASPPHYQYNPVKTIKVNMFCSSSLLKLRDPPVTHTCHSPCRHQPWGQLTCWDWPNASRLGSCWQARARSMEVNIPMLLLILHFACSIGVHLTFAAHPADPEVHPQPESYWGNVNTIGPRVRVHLVCLAVYCVLVCMLTVQSFVSI